MPPTGRAIPGTVVGGRYQLRAAIGNGGMGTVWQAVDTVLRRDVAVKEVLLPPGMPPNERSALYERTLREGRAAAALSHPSVVQVYDVVTDDGRPWIVMELLQARSLSEIIISDGPIAGRAVAKIGIALLGALEVAHAAGVLHRDVKPANVLICADGRCVLTDFGVARMPAESNLTQPGMVLGSPHFISPERAIGAAFGPPSDLFSLGVTLYTAAEGRPPFDRGDPFETMRAIVEEQPAAPVRAGVLTSVLMGLLEKDPDRRWTVPDSRRVLRDLIAGPLNNRAPQHVTDPYAVMPAQPVEPLAMPPVPTGRLGGRAMLADGETASDRLRANSAAAAGADYPGVGYTDATEPGIPMVRRSRATDPRATDPRHTDPRHPDPRRPDPRDSDPWNPDRRNASDLTAPLPAVGRRGLVGDLTESIGRIAAGAWATVRSWPRLVRLGAIVGLGLVILIGTVVIATHSNSPTGRPNAAVPTATPGTSTPLPFEVQKFRDSRGMTVDVPADWKKAAAATYTNFSDPDDPSRRMRLNVEPSGNSTPQQFLTSAERNLRNGNCTAPYARIGLTDIMLDGHPAAQLEYTCGSGTGKRHGIWAATTLNGHAYHFYLTVPDSDFEASKIIYTEMVRSFRLTATN